MSMTELNAYVDALNELNTPTKSSAQSSAGTSSTIKEYKSLRKIKAKPYVPHSTTQSKTS